MGLARLDADRVVRMLRKADLNAAIPTDGVMTPVPEGALPLNARSVNGIESETKPERNCN